MGVRVEDFCSFVGACRCLVETGFREFFRMAEIVCFDKDELVEYEESLKVFRDLNNVINTTELKRDIKKAFEIVAKLKVRNVSLEKSAENTGLSMVDINRF